MSLISLGRLFYQQSELGDYRTQGRHLQGTVLQAEVWSSSAGGTGLGRSTSHRHNYVNFQATLNGQRLETPLNHTEDIIETLKPGQMLEVVYLDSAKQQTPDGRIYFFDDQFPVPLAYVRQNRFTSSEAYRAYAFALGTALLLWLGWRKPASTKPKAAA